MAFANIKYANHYYYGKDKDLFAGFLIRILL